MKTPIELIGRSGVIQRVMRGKFTLLRAAILRGEETSVLRRRVLFTGPPGVGKTELGGELSLLMAGSPYAVEKLNGQNVTIDVVREWTRNACYKPLFGDISVKFVDEIDAIGPAALNDLRTYLDELAPHRVFIGCTNQPPGKLQPQLQSRFQVIQFAPIPALEIAVLLRAKYQLPLAIAAEIAQKSGGNVRAAEADAIIECDVNDQTLLDALTPA